MQMTLMLTIASAFLVGVVAAEDLETNPIQKVLQLMDDLSAKITKDGEAADKSYKEYFEWCDDTTTNQQQEIKSGTTQKNKLEASVEELSSNIEDATDKIEKLGAKLSKITKELDEATTIREKEKKEFVADEKELVEAVDMLQRAIDIISREMSKNPGSFAQMQTSSRNIAELLRSLSLVTEAAAFSSADQQRLLALVQSQQSDEDGDLGAPAAASYKSKSGGIVDVLEDMKEKAESQLREARKAETTSKQNYMMLKQALEGKMGADGKEMEDTKASRSADEEAKAVAEGDLDVTSKALASNKDELQTTRHDCIRVARDHEKAQKDRKEELSVIAEAKKIIIEATGGGAAASLLQVSASTRVADVAGIVKRLARQQHSAALAQLASRIQAVVRLGTTDGADPFGKVKGLITDMIAKLESEASEAAEEKAFCDEEMSKTEAKKGELEEDQDKLKSGIEEAKAKSALLKDEVVKLQAELAKLAKEQEAFDTIRNEQNADFLAQKADLEKGLAGVKKAIQVLKDYYGNAGASLIQDSATKPAPPQGHSKSAGGAGGIIDILEVAESDMSKTLADIEGEESDSKAEYNSITQKNKVVKAEKDQAVKYKTQEYKGLDKSIGDMTSDIETVDKELAAVNEYYAKIKGKCIAKPETYEERKKRREAEIAGLKEALVIIENETAFLQRSTGRRNLRASHRRTLAAAA